MRNKLIKLLRCLEEESGFKNEYTEFFEQYGCDYSVEEYLVLEFDKEFKKASLVII